MRSVHGSVDDWLIHCADPMGMRNDARLRALSPTEAAKLVTRSEAHGVLPSVLRHFPFPDGTVFAQIKDDAAARYRKALAYALILRRQGEAITTAARGLPAVIVKGPVFARLIYPVPGLRPFTDIDLLADASAVPGISQLLAEQGFSLAERGRGQFAANGNGCIAIMRP